MKKSRLNLTIFVFMLVMVVCSVMGVVAFAAAEPAEAVPEDNVRIQINVGPGEENVTTVTTNPNGVTTEGIVWKGLLKSSWTTANDAGCFSNIGDVAELKVGIVLRFVQPVTAKYFNELKFSFFPGSTGTIYAFDSKTTDLTAANARASLKVTGMKSNTITMVPEVFADADGKVSEITFLLDRADTTDWFFGTFNFMLKEEYLPVEEAVDHVLIATEDPATSPITGRTQGENLNVNDVKIAYTYEAIQTNGTVGSDGKVTGGYLADKYGYATARAWKGSLLATVLKLKTPIDAVQYDTFTLTAYYGARGDFSLYPSTAKRYIRETAVATLNVPKEYEEYAITAKASALAKEDGKIYDVTLAMECADSDGQIFFKNIVMKKADGTETVIDFLQRDGIISSDETNPNKVNTTAYIFDATQKQSWADAGMGLCTNKAWIDAGTALIVEFQKPISVKLYDKMEFKLFSGLKGVLEIYPSSAKAFIPSKAVASKEMKQFEANTFKLFLKDLADETGKVRNFTIFLPNQLSKENGSYTAGQIFFGEAKITAKTETSYLDELVLTDATQKSITTEGAAQFITENIPEATGEKGAYDATQALKITGETTINFKKLINQQETECGNVHMRFYRASGSPITKLTFTKVGDTSVVNEYDVSGNAGWFDLVLPIMDYLNAEGNIGGVIVKADKEGEIIFGGAEVEDKLRILDEKITKADISEVVPMTEEGLTYKSTGKVNYTPLFENMNMNKNAITFKLKVNDMSDFNVMFNIAGAGKVTNGIWFWFDKNGISMVGGSRGTYPASVKENEWFDVEIGTIPYTVSFMPYGVKAYIKVNGETVLESNIDATVQATGKWFAAYVHQTKADTQILIAPLQYQKTDVVTLETTSGERTLNIGDTDKIVVSKNIELDGQEISKIEVVSGDSVTIDESGFIKAVKVGTTVFKVTVSGVGIIPEQEVTISIEANQFYTVKIGGKSIQVKAGDKITLPELNPPKEGLVFAGLFTDKECKNKFDYEKTAVTSDLTLYVGWMEKPAEVPDEKPKKSGCGSAILSVPAIGLSVTAIAISVATLRKRKGDE